MRAHRRRPGPPGAGGPACTAAEACVRGSCVTEACACALQTRSYVGCDYWLSDLQSFRYAGLDGDSVRGAPWASW
ncbi:MAG: hypothetical protein R3F43_09235 [bacterium]